MGKPQTAIELVRDHADQFAAVLPKHMTADRMARLALSAFKSTPKLAACTVQSVGVSMMGCSVLGLEPNTPLGHAYLVPFNTKQPDGSYQMVCQLIIGYRGYIELFYRSGAVSSVNVFPVFEADEFNWELGLEPRIRHVPSRDRGRVSPENLTHVYPVIRLVDTNALPIWDVYDRDVIDFHMNRSMPVKRNQPTPWKSDFIPMAQKTGIRKIHRWVPFSVERAVPSAAAYEEAIERGHIGTAVQMLGDDAAELTNRLVGDVEDQPEQPVEQEDPLAGRGDIQVKPSTSQLSERHQKIVEAYRAVWGDKAMGKISEDCRNSEPKIHSFISANSDELEYLECTIYASKGEQ